jgi:hypothetical protein
MRLPVDAEISNSRIGAHAVKSPLGWSMRCLPRGAQLPLALLDAVLDLLYFVQGLFVPPRFRKPLAQIIEFNLDLRAFDHHRTLPFRRHRRVPFPAAMNRYHSSYTIDG